MPVAPVAAASYVQPLPTGELQALNEYPNWVTGSACGVSGAASAPSGNASGATTIVLDPGHAPKANEAVDPATKLPVFDYENDPEMAQVWQVAQDVKNTLQNDGYTVLLTKSSLDDSSTNLKKRAEVANNANAALGVSLHTTPGNPSHDNNVFYPGVGNYVVTTTGTHDVYTNSGLANTDQKDASAMASALQNVEGQPWHAGTYANIYGPISRTDPITGTVMKGNMLTTQYFAKVPWVYAEQTQDAPGASVSPGLLSKYADGVAKGIENIVPIPGPGSAPGVSGSTCSCSTGSVSAGSGAPDGAAFPNLDPAAMASAINTWIKQENPQSKLSGLGSTIVASAKNSNVNPFLIVSIAKEESSLSDPGDYNVIHAHNSFGRTAGPGQPSFQGAKSWYKWSSVEASVDYTAPENKNIPGGGDMATYLRDQYGSSISGNNLVALMEAYSPPGQNNTAQYIANIKSWTQQLIKLTTGGSGPAVSNPSSPGGCGSVNCTSGGVSAGSVTGNAAILCEAEKYAGIYYLWGGGHESYSTFRQNCPLSALSSAAGSSTVSNPGPCGTDCSGLVSVAVDAAFNQSFTWSVSNSTGFMVGSGSNYWKSIPISQAQAGDIVTTNAGNGSPGDGHVEIVMYVKGNTVYTFGSHSPGVKTGPTNAPSSYWSQGAWHWTGPGGSP